jgi:hypothetical protein
MTSESAGPGKRDLLRHQRGPSTSRAGRVAPNSSPCFSHLLASAAVADDSLAGPGRVPRRRASMPGQQLRGPPPACYSAQRTDSAIPANSRV